MLQNMLKLIKHFTFDTPIKHAKHSVTPMLNSHRISNFSSNSYSDSPSDRPTRGYGVSVGIFWDVDSKFRESYYPFHAAFKLRRMAEQLGFVNYIIAHADPRAWTYAPMEVKKKRIRFTRKFYDKFDNVVPEVPRVVVHLCNMCKRKFYNFERMVNHFRDVHEREYKKRVRTLEDAKGKRRAYLVGRYSMKMEKFKYAAREMFNLQHGYCLAEELKRGGFWVREVPHKSQAHDESLRDLILDMMEHKRVGCVVLVTEDPDYVEVLREAKSRNLKTVVVADDNDALKRIAHLSLSWEQVMRRRAKAAAVSAVGKWKDFDVLRRLEWTYDPKTDGKKLYPEIESDMESEFVEFISDEDDDEDDVFLQKGNAGAWWELQSDDTTSPVNFQAGKND